MTMHASNTAISQTKKQQARAQAIRQRLEKRLYRIQSQLETKVARRVKELRQINAKLQKEVAERQQAEEILRKRTHDLGERVKELRCLYAVSRLIARREASLEELLQQTVELIPPAWQYPEITEARAIVGRRIFQTAGFRRTRWIQTCPIMVDGKRVGRLEVCYTAPRPALDDGPFLKEERNLLQVLAERIGRMVKQNRAEEALRSQQELLAISEQNLKTFSQRILQVREEEKKKLSVDLHDQLGAMVVAVDSRLSIAHQEILEQELPQAIETLRQTRQSLQDFIGQLKKIAGGLRPPDLDILGLPSALRRLAADFERRTQLKVSCRILTQTRALSNEKGIILYRVAQEALTNVFKHAQARRAGLCLSRRKGSLHLAIRDDGRGFDPRFLFHSPGELHLGLRGMKEQLEAVGGQLAVQSHLGAGTRIRACIPSGKGDPHDH